MPRRRAFVHARRPLHARDRDERRLQHLGRRRSLNYVNGSASFNNFSPRFTAFYAIDDQTNLYATISRGFKAGGVEAQPVAAGRQPGLQARDLVELRVRREERERRQAAAPGRRRVLDELEGHPGGLLDRSGRRAAACLSSPASPMRPRRAATASKPRRPRWSRPASPSAPAPATTGPTTSASRTRRAGSARPAISRGATLPNSPKWTLHADSQYTHNFAADAVRLPAARVALQGRHRVRPEFRIPHRIPVGRALVQRLEPAGGNHAGHLEVTAFVENFLDKKYYTNAYEKAFVDGMFIEPWIPQCRRQVHRPDQVGTCVRA